MRDLYRFVVLSDHALARAARASYRAATGFSLPAPALLMRPAAGVYRGARTAYHFAARVLLAEPVFKGMCRSHGRNLHTGSSVHWVQGDGDIVLGDDVLIDGRCAITFSSAYVARPTLRIGDRTVVGHGSTLVVGRAINIGADCLIAGEVSVFDSPGHPTEPEARRARQRPAASDVRAVVVEDNVWIGRGAVICPGVTVGMGSIVTARSVVVADVPAYSVVMGNPARRVLRLDEPAAVATRERRGPVAVVPGSGAGRDGAGGVRNGGGD
jgi:acetyltransferase-like isoleucine patch superfamily enzyme